MSNIFPLAGGSSMSPVLAISGAPTDAVTGKGYFYRPSVTGGAVGRSLAFSLSAGTLPEGFTFSTHTGTIRGSATTPGTASGLAITVTDGFSTATLSGLSIVVTGAATGGGGGGATPVIAIASVRSKLPVTVGPGTGAYGTTTTPYIYYRSIHKANKLLRDPWGIFWNGAVDSSMGNAAWEHGPTGGQVKTIRGALWTGIVDPLLADQTGATVWPLTFAGIQAGAKRIKDLSYTTRTWADFVAAGGAVSGDSKTVTIPSGWSVEYDSIVGLSLPKNQKYFCVVEDGTPGAAAGTPLQSVRGGITQGANDKGDRTKNNATVAITTAGKHLCEDPNWTSGNGVSGVSTASACTAPIIMLGMDDTGLTKTVNVDGDSINDENNDTLRDADGVAHGISRALNAAGYSFFKTAAFSSSMNNQQTYGGNAYRLGLLEYADAVITNHGHNDSSFLTAENTLKPLIRYHGIALRTNMRAAKRVVRMTLTPTGKAGTARAGGSTTTVQLASSESAVNDFYVGTEIKMHTGTAAGQYGTITAYDGSTKIATVNPSNTWSVAVVGGNYGLNYPNADPATDGTYTIANPYFMRTGPYAGVPFDTAAGDPNAGLDAFASYGAANGKWASVLDSFDMTHPSGIGAGKSETYFTASMLTAAVGFAP